MDTWHLETVDVTPHRPRILRTDVAANRVILLALPAGELLRDHEVRERALVFVASGEVTIRQSGNVEALRAPGLVHFDPSERQEVEAIRENRLVICLAPWGGGFHDRQTAERVRGDRPESET